MSNLPNYVEHPFRQTLPGKINLKNVDMLAFWLQGDFGKISDLCNSIFANPSGGKVIYRPLTSHIMVTLVDIKEGRFADVPDMGWSGERELAFWITMVKIRKFLWFEFIERVGLFNPLLVLDNQMAVATGRETYGYMKQYGWIDIPSQSPLPQTITVDAFATDVFGSNTEQQRTRFLTLEPVGQLLPLSSVREPWPDIRAITKDLSQALESRIELELPSMEVIEQFYEDLIGMKVPQVMLKQFRDIAKTSLACYQAILETPVKMSGVSGLQLQQPYNLTIEKLDSLDVEKVLGIPLNKQINFMTRINLDMEMDTGKEIWSAT